MRHDATSSTAAKPRKMRRLGLEPTRCRWICPIARPRAATAIAMHKPPAATLLAMLLLLLAAAALTVCFQPTDRVPGVAVRYYSLSGSPTQVNCDICLRFQNVLRSTMLSLAVCPLLLLLSQQMITRVESCFPLLF